jgi:hypothetical protein
MEALAPLFEPDNLIWTTLSLGGMAFGAIAYELRSQLKALFRKF